MACGVTRGEGRLPTCQLKRPPSQLLPSASPPLGGGGGGGGGGVAGSLAADSPASLTDAMGVPFALLSALLTFGSSSCESASPSASSGARSEAIGVPLGVPTAVEHPLATFSSAFLTFSLTTAAALAVMPLIPGVASPPFLTTFRATSLRA